MISQYNLSPEERYGIKNLFHIVTKRIKMQGFIVGDTDMGPKYLKERNERVSAVGLRFCHQYLSRLVLFLKAC